MLQGGWGRFDGSAIVAASLRAAPVGADDVWGHAAVAMLGAEEDTMAFDEEMISTLASITEEGLSGAYDDISSYSDVDGGAEADMPVIEPYDERASPLLPHDEAELAAMLADIGLGGCDSGSDCSDDATAFVPSPLVSEVACSEAGFACNSTDGSCGASTADASVDEIAGALQGLSMFTPKQLRAQNWQLGLPEEMGNEQVAATINAVVAAGAVAPAVSEAQDGEIAARAPGVPDQRGKPNLSLLRRAAEHATRQEAAEFGGEELQAKVYESQEEGAKAVEPQYACESSTQGSWNTASTCISPGSGVDSEYSEDKDEGEGWPRTQVTLPEEKDEAKPMMYCDPD